MHSILGKRAPRVTYLVVEEIEALKDWFAYRHTVGGRTRNESLV